MGAGHIDYLADNLLDGGKLRMITVVDCCSLESLAVHVGQCLKGKDVDALLDGIGQLNAAKHNGRITQTSQKKQQKSLVDQKSTRQVRL